MYLFKDNFFGGYIWFFVLLKLYGNWQWRHNWYKVIFWVTSQNLFLGLFRHFLLLVGRNALKIVSIYLFFMVVLNKKGVSGPPHLMAYSGGSCNYLFSLYLGFIMVQKGSFCICTEPNLHWHISPNCSTIYWDPFGSRYVTFGTQRTIWIPKMFFCGWKIGQMVLFKTEIGQISVFISLFDVQQMLWLFLTLPHTAFTHKAL